MKRHAGINKQKELFQRSDLIRLELTETKTLQIKKKSVKQKRSYILNVVQDFQGNKIVLLIINHDLVAHLDILLVGKYEEQE